MSRNVHPKMLVLTLIFLIINISFVFAMPPHPDMEPGLRVQAVEVYLRAKARWPQLDAPGPLQQPIGTYRAIVLLVDFSDKALEVLLNNPEMMIEANYLIAVNKDAVSGVLDGSEGIIYDTDEIVAFLDAYAKKAPPVLKVLAKIVQWDMLRKQRRGELFLGFRLK